MGIVRREFLKWAGFFGGGAAVVKAGPELRTKYAGSKFATTPKQAQALALRDFDEKWAKLQEVAATPGSNWPVNPAGPPYYLQVLPGAYYDRLQLLGGSTARYEHHLFSCGLGQPGSDGRVKEFADTNMYMGGTLPAPCQLFVKRVLWVFPPSNSERDRAMFLDRAYFEFRVMQKAYRRGPIVLGAVESDVEQLLAERRGSLAGCTPIGHNCSIRTNVVIPACANFGVKVLLDPFTPEQPFSVYCFLDGEEARGVQ